MLILLGCFLPLQLKNCSASNTKRPQRNIFYYQTIISLYSFHKDVSNLKLNISILILTNSIFKIFVSQFQLDEAGLSNKYKWENSSSEVSPIGHSSFYHILVI